MLIGVNVFQNGSTFAGSDVAWVKKPAVGSIATCPSSLTTGVLPNLSQGITPNPAKQTDWSSTGYVVTNADPGSASSTALYVYTVTNSSGVPVLSSPKTVTVGSYAYPPSAPQPRTGATLDTLDARLMSAWAAPDPSQGGATAIWTGHTVAASSGGLGAEFRWYEINPATGGLYRSGRVQSASVYVFMGAVSPDRNGTSGLFGSNALMAFNTSSTNAYPAAAMASFAGGSQSGIATVFTSRASDTDFTCHSVCRWGDYSGASPDPASSSAGQAWSTVMTMASKSTYFPTWGSRNWAATP